MKKLIVLFMAGLLTCVLYTKAQPAYKCYYEVGKHCPEYTFNNIVNYSKKETGIKDFRGKWLILDFWNEDCSACIASFPKTNAEQKQCGQNVQFLLVGELDSKENKIIPLYDQLKSRLHLTMPCAFDYSLVKDSVDELQHGMPFLVIIDPDGIVRGSGPTLESIGVDFRTLSLTNRPALHDYYREHFKLYKYNNKHPLLVNNNGAPDTSFLFRSVLTKWQLSEPSEEFGTLTIPPGRVTGLGQPIPVLYFYAYAGINPGTLIRTPSSSLYAKIWPKPLIEVRDTSRLHDFDVGNNNRYSYELTVPPSKATRVTLMRMMQQDLANYFGYKIKTESREMPCWKLVATDKAKVQLLTKGGPKVDKYAGREGGYIARNISVAWLIENVVYFTKLYGNEAPFLVNETGITGNIDIDLDFSGIDLDSMLTALRKNGLDLVKGKNEMQVLVISDSTTNAKP